jgi:OLD-like protein
VHLDERDGPLPVESELAALRTEGLSRTRATELVIERAVARAFDSSIVVLVEGLSDHIVVEVLAARRGRNLADEGVSVVPMGGATNIRRFLALFGPQGRDVTLAGLYDSAEEAHFGRSLEQAGFGRGLDRTRLESLGFYVCVADLEDELIRCLGPSRIEQVIEAEGELVSFRTMQIEPFHRGRTREQQLHRFIGTHSGRKYRYARLLAEALDLTRVPTPLDGLLAHL